VFFKSVNNSQRYHNKSSAHSYQGRAVARPVPRSFRQRVHLFNALVRRPLNPWTQTKSNQIKFIRHK